MSDRLDELLDAWCDDVIDDAGVAELDRLLASPSAAEHAALRLALHAQLQADGRAISSLGADAASLRASSSGRRALRRGRRRMPSSSAVGGFVAGAAASLAIVALLLMRLGGGRAAEAGDVARLTSGDAVLVSDGVTRPLAPGATVRRGDRLRATGPAAIAWADGSRVGLDPGCDATIAGDEHDKRLVLARGRATADVEPQRPGCGFSLASEAGEARAIGTRFSLVVDARRTRLEVEHGIVALTRSADHARLEVAAACSADIAADAPFVVVGPPATPPAAGMIDGFTLIEADTGAAIPGYDPIPAHAVLDIGVLRARRVSIAARVDGVAGVDFTLTRDRVEIHRQAERSPPYTLYGDVTGTPNATPWPVEPGAYRLTATPVRAADDHRGPVTVAELDFVVR